MDLQHLVDQVHSEVNSDRLKRGKPLWDWDSKQEAPMETELCGPCKDAGFSIIAHYKPTLAGMSHDGKYHPPMCYDHKNGKIPRWIAEKQPQIVPKKSKEVPMRRDENDYTPLTADQEVRIRQLAVQGLTYGAIADQIGVKVWRVNRIAAQARADACSGGKCPCGKPESHRGKCLPSASVAISPRHPTISVEATRTKVTVSHPVDSSISNELDRLKEKILSQLQAIEIVERLLREQSQ